MNVKKANNRTKSAGFRNPAHYRLDFIKENTFNTLWSVRMTRTRVWLVSIACFAAIAAFLWCVVAFTPLRQLLPGALHGDLRARYLDAAVRLDSLENITRINEAYISNLAEIFRGPETKPKLEEAPVVSVPDSLLSASEQEKQFVRSYEAEERFNLSVLAPIAAEGMLFSAPVPMAESARTLPGANSLEIHARGAMPATAVYRGTVISVTVRPDGKSVVVVQHPNDFISVYDGLTDVYIRRGDKVGAAQRIGAVPAKGTMQFELWHKGTPLNPAEYIAV